MVVVILLHSVLLRKVFVMKVELDINNDYILVSFSRDELLAIAQKAIDTENAVITIIYDFIRIGYNQGVLEE